MFATDIMTKAVKTIHSTSSVRTAIEDMVNHGVSGLPVVDEDDILGGMITEGDLLRRVEFGAAANSEKHAGDSAFINLTPISKAIAGAWRI